MVFSEEDVKLLKIAVNGQKESETPRYSEEELSNLEAGTANQHVSFKAQKDIKKLKKRQTQLKKQARDYQKGPMQRGEAMKTFLTKNEYGKAQEGLLALIKALVASKVITNGDIEKAFQIMKAEDYPDMCEYCEKKKDECKASGIIKKDATVAGYVYPLVGNQSKLGKRVIQCTSFVQEQPPKEPQKKGGDNGGDSGKNKS